MKYNNNYQILILLPLFFFYTEDIGVDQAFKTDPKKRSHLIANRATNSVLSSFLPEKVCEGKIVLPTHFSKGDTLTPPFLSVPMPLHNVNKNIHFGKIPNLRKVVW